MRKHYDLVRLGTPVCILCWRHRRAGQGWRSVDQLKPGDSDSDGSHSDLRLVDCAVHQHAIAIVDWKANLAVLDFVRGSHRAFVALLFSCVAAWGSFTCRARR